VLCVGLRSVHGVPSFPSHNLPLSSAFDAAYRRYETQTPELQAAVRGLVARKQLVFINGGWSMHGA
jgi:hypothetical protein